MSSILREALLESKKIKEEALALAKQSLLKEHKGTLDKLATELFRRKMNESKEKEEDKKDDDKANIDTRSMGDEIEDYLDSEIGKSDKGDIEIEIDLSDEKDDKKIEETFNALAENDEVLVIKEKEFETNDKLKSEMESAKKEITEMENINKELSDLEVDLKEDITDDIIDGGDGGSPIPTDDATPIEPTSDGLPVGDDDQIAEAFNSMSEEEKNKILQGLSTEEMDELAEALVLALDAENQGGDAPAGEAPIEVVPSETPVATSEVPTDVPPVEEKPVEEGMSGAISHANARKQGTSQTSDGKVEHSREYVKTLESIQETVGKLSNEAKRLEEENKALKMQMSALNESSSKLKGQNSEYATQLSK